MSAFSPINFILLVILQVSIFVLICSGERIRASNGESCGVGSNRCDSRQSLTCRNGICECLMPDAMTFDGGKKTCVVLAGEKCSYTAVEVRDDDEDDGVQEKMWKEELSCVSNANCLSSGFCGCSSTFKESKNGTCEPKYSFGDECESNSECREDLNLSCEDGKCSCNPILSIYDKERAKCITRAGANCDIITECPPNAKCESHSGSRQCVCNEGYYVSNKTGTCEAKVSSGEECEADFQCQKSGHFPLKCISGKCQCGGEGIVYDPSFKRCARKFNETCTPRYDYSECVYPGRCTESYYSYPARCSCENYIPASNGFCMGGYDNSCDSNGGTFLCNAEQGLVCLDKRCKCEFPEHQQYSSGLKTCISLVRGPCGNSSSSNACTANAECVHVEKGTYECRCKAGFISVDRKCELAYGQSCSNQNLQCDQRAKLHCISGICRCKGYQMYQKKEQKCRGMVGAACYMNDDFCVSGAACKQFRSIGMQNQGICQCQDGFTQENNRTCSLSTSPVKAEAKVMFGNKTNVTDSELNDIMPKDEGYNNDN